MHTAKLFNITGAGLTPVKQHTFTVGQIVWLNGYGQSKSSHDRRALYEIDGRYAKWVNLDKPQRGRQDLCMVEHENDIFGIGVYFTPGQFATNDEITNALAAAINAEENEKTVKAAADIAYAEFMAPWGDLSQLPQGTINRAWFKNAMRAGKLLVKCDGKYTDDYAGDAASNFRKDSFFKDCPTDRFNDWYISCIRIYGNKAGKIDVSFASCEYFTFLLKPEYLHTVKK